jgi:hypothetical protein
VKEIYCPDCDSNANAIVGCGFQYEFLTTARVEFRCTNGHWWHLEFVSRSPNEDATVT